MPGYSGKARKLLMVAYLTDCLHFVIERPGKKVVFCPACLDWHAAIELRKV
jgi:hypothetical protein